MDTTAKRQDVTFELALVPSPEAGAAHRPLCYTSCYSVTPVGAGEAEAHRSS
ncbi:hypothetical protein [Streptomyces sp. NPDC057939]|uniref:hypothetical protein n=1 Tax=Streptomyces sp. NPDC057939 TaxID=3346284 RepID=UPI0036EE303E